MKIAVAMSGGVDSSVVARLLKDEGHELVGLFLKLWTDPTSPSGLRGTCPTSCGKENRCCDYEALEDARKVAALLKIPFYVINASEAFKKAVVDDFLAEYQSLRTPNPCIVCNDKIKFDLLLQKALALGCDKLATGHYARVASISPESRVQSPEKRTGDWGLGAWDYHLLTGIDQTKDQSYMLYRLNQHQLSKILFPLGGMTKKEVRAKAVEWDLPVKEKPESQEICFIDDDYRSFLKRYSPESFIKGDIVNQKGKVVGKHEGLINYTIGQRKGIDQTDISTFTHVIPEKSGIPAYRQAGKINKGIPHRVIYARLRKTPLGDLVGMTKQKKDREPLYVIGFNKKNNQLIVGEDQEVFEKEMIVADLNWIGSGCRLEPHLCHPESSPCHPELTPMCHPELAEGSGRLSGSIRVKIRYRHPAVECTLARHCAVPAGRQEESATKQSQKRDCHAEAARNDNIKVLFKNPQRAITPGQSAVFYLGDQVLGGGLIFG